MVEKANKRTKEEAEITAREAEISN